jgi:hypothetical protein
MRSISRITGVSINTVTKLLEDAGRACAAYHVATVHGVKAPAIVAGIRQTAYDLEWVVGLIDATAPKPGSRGSYKKNAIL